VTSLPPALTGKQIRHLRALAHARRPLVRIGHGGLTDAVLLAIGATLETHELVKVRVGAADDTDLGELAARIERGTRSRLVQIIGRHLVLYRRHPKKPRLALPAATAKGSRRARDAGEK
jgi:RNA-binding protein